jgi:hypothetical protein
MSPNSSGSAGRRVENAWCVAAVFTQSRTTGAINVDIKSIEHGVFVPERAAISAIVGCCFGKAQ